MNALILYAHPCDASFNHAVLEQVQRGLRDGNHSFRVIDLYKEGFDPALKFGGERKRSELASDWETARYREWIKEADRLILIYPVWWYGLPAILKGFFDRVFVSGFAYSSAGGRPKGLLVGKSAWAVYTIDSPPLVCLAFPPQRRMGGAAGRDSGVLRNSAGKAEDLRQPQKQHGKSEASLA